MPGVEFLFRAMHCNVLPPPLSVLVLFTAKETPETPFVMLQRSYLQFPLLLPAIDS